MPCLAKEKRPLSGRFGRGRILNPLYAPFRPLFQGFACWPASIPSEPVTIDRRQLSNGLRQTEVGAPLRSPVELKPYHSGYDAISREIRELSMLSDFSAEYSQRSDDELL